jgi:two-component system NarL family response regulator
MDIEMPGENGIALTAALHEKHPDVRVIMLTAFSDSERVFAALKAGAVGYLLKNVSPDEIRSTVERVAAGEPMLSGEIAGRVLREFERERQEERYREKLDALTEREEEILKLLATGDSNREIGARLSISEQTVKNHVANIFRKLQVNDRTKAAILALRLGLGPPASDE